MSATFRQPPYAHAGPSASSLDFRLLAPSPGSGAAQAPRAGELRILLMPNGSFVHENDVADGANTLAEETVIKTPGLVASTRRGTVPHLTRDNLDKFPSPEAVFLPMEHFLDPLPQPPPSTSWPHGIHSFLGFQGFEGDPDVPNRPRKVVCMGLRDPADGTDLPYNTDAWVTVRTGRGYRKVSSSVYYSYLSAYSPDIIIAFADDPTVTNPPPGAKRVEKSIVRSLKWLEEGIRARDRMPSRPHIFAQLIGSNSVEHRESFAQSLLERVSNGPANVCGDEHSASTSAMGSLDDDVAGYALPLTFLRRYTGVAVPRSSQSAVDDQRNVAASHQHPMTTLLLSSLRRLPPSKPRLAQAARGPHEMLRLISTVGVDLFDASWAIECADIGFALDFEFFEEDEQEVRLVESKSKGKELEAATGRPLMRQGADGRERKDIGHNLYDQIHKEAFVPILSSSPIATSVTTPRRRCECLACSPRPPTFFYLPPTEGHPPNADPAPYTRAYIHHLLASHEMLGHTLLAAHNLCVVQSFLDDVRKAILRDSGVIADGEEPAEERLSKSAKRGFKELKQSFLERYDEQGAGEEEARKLMRAVYKARGKGREIARFPDIGVALAAGTDGGGDAATSVIATVGATPREGEVADEASECAKG